MANLGNSSVIRRRPTTSSSPKPNGKLQLGACGFPILSHYIEAKVNKLRPVYQEYLHEFPSWQQSRGFQSGVRTEIFDLEYSIRAADSTCKLYTDGANALNAIALGGSCAERQLMLAQARFELCKQSFLYMAEMFALGHKKLVLADRPVEAEVVRREFNECDRELRQAFDDLVLKFPSMRSIIRANGIEIENRRAAIATKLHAWKKPACLIGLEVLWIAIALCYHSANVVGTYQGLHSMYDLVRINEAPRLSDLSSFLPVRSLAGVYGAQAVAYLISRLHGGVTQSIGSQNEVVGSGHETQDCPICYTDLFDFAPDDIGIAEAIPHGNGICPSDAPAVPAATDLGRSPFSSLARKIKSWNARYHKVLEAINPDVSAIKRLLESPRKYFKVVKRTTPIRPWPRPVRCRWCKQAFHAECVFRWMDRSVKCPYCQGSLGQKFRSDVLRPLVDKHRVQKREVRQRQSRRSST